MPNTKKTKKILISGYYGFDNLGDDLVLEVLVKKLKVMGLNIEVLSGNPEKTYQSYGVKSTFYKSYGSVISSILNSDILISGGGSLLQDVTSLKSLLYYLFVINTALLFGKKVIIFSQGIGPLNNWVGKLLTKLTLQKCQFVSVRDRKSRMVLSKWNILSELINDPICDLKLLQTEKKPIVGIQLRNCKNLSNFFIQSLAQEVSRSFADKEVEIYSFQDSMDLEVCKNFQSILRSFNPDIKTTLMSNTSTKEIVDKISHLEYMIAMRFHANLLALKYGIKTLAFAYDIKVEKLAQEANIPCGNLNKSQNFEKLFEQLKNLNSQNLLEYSQSKTFDWEKIEQAINQ